MTSVPRWLADLRPVAEPQLAPLARGSPVLAWHVTVAFERWPSPPGSPRPTWAETYGKAQIMGGDGRRSVAEIELTRRLREAGWRAGWLDTFGAAPRGWRDWLIEPSALPAPVRDALEGVARALGTTKAGRPDVVAWRGTTPAEAIFVEYKGPSDRIRPGQDAWCRAARAAGVSHDQFAVARWPRALGGRPGSPHTAAEPAASDWS